jgi:hypothetical protein
MPQESRKTPAAIGTASEAGPVASFITVGKPTSQIDVRISYRIIELFSQGLYRSPNKAVEELVSNAFDAGATKVHVIMSPDLVPNNATIAVIDNGIGMDEAGLRQHWLIGVSNKREEGQQYPRNRKQIGRFGIGKLATYVLANRLTHVAKCARKFYATTMDYTQIPPAQGGGIYAEQPVTLPLRHLTEAEAKAALAPWLGKAKPGYAEIPLFGKGAAKSWTVAILSDLKDMSREIQRGRLRWVLATAMPIRDDFNLYLDGDPVTPAMAGKRLHKWVLGKSLGAIPKPAPDDLQVTEDDSEEKKSPHRFGLTHPQLGRITGYAELYDDLLTGGKASEAGRSHGFFVYVRNRLINIDDEYFGIDSNLLRHGTFARFRMVAHIDRLDDELRSSRESIREGSLLIVARNILRGVFNHVRVQHELDEASQRPGVQAAQRIAATAASLSRRPLVALITSAFAGDFVPRYTICPKFLSKAEQKTFLEELEKLVEAPEGFIKQIKLVDGSSYSGLAMFDASSRTLEINSLHPYVAHFLDEFEHKSNVPLELLAMSEVLLEAHLFELGLASKLVHDAMEKRDELLRSLSRSTGKRNARLVAQALADACTNKDALEAELVASFDSMGFDNVVRIGGSGKPDGYAEARLGGTEAGAAQSYKLTLEAKSKEKPGAKVSAKSVGVSTIARQRDDYKADYAIVVGPDFPTTQAETSALGQEIAADRERNPGKGITLIRIDDMARLIRLVPAKRVGLHRLFDLFRTCSLPDEAKKWIDDLAAEKMQRPPYRELLDAIASEQKDMPAQAIEYANVVTRLRVEKKLALDRTQVVDLCKALSMMAPGYVYARSGSVELTQRPDKILEAIKATIHEYPEEEQKGIAAPK